jgi:hypothetical protein
MKRLTVLLVLILFIPACGASASSATITPAVTSTMAEPTTTVTPTATTVILVTGGSVQAEIDRATTILTSLSQSNGLSLETRDSIQTGDLLPTWKVVVFLHSPGDIGGLTAATPQTQFILLTTADQSGTGNVTTIRLYPEYQAFMAGYISMLIAEDWRGAGLLINDDSTGGRLAEAFQNGAYYYCGTCSPAYPPYGTSMPDTAVLPSSSDANTWKAAFEPMITDRIYDLYVMSEAANPDLMGYLASLGLRLFGTASPAEAYKPNWVVTIVLDPWEAVQEHWTEILAGGAGLTLSGGITFTDIDEAFLGAGKQRLLNEVVQQLESGLIYPFNP